MQALIEPRSRPVARPPATDPLTHVDLDARIDAACEQACRAMAPTWPLDQAIAVNPHWERIGSSVRAVAARMAVLGDIRVFAPRARLRQAWMSGRIVPGDLHEALARLPEAAAKGLDAEQAVAALSTAQNIARLPLLIDALDGDPQGQRRLSWRQAITHQVSQVCAAYFDRDQADWQPDRSAGLYAFWRDTLTHDHGIGALMGLPELGRRLAALPATRQDAERWALRRLGLPEAVWADYLEAVLLTVNGWASWCAYLAWQARLANGADSSLRDLLAIRLAWGAVLLECCDAQSARQAFCALQADWAQAPARLRQAEAALLVDEIWQLAFEVGYQRRLARRLLAVAPRPPAATGEDAPVQVQAAFCIDVRSEPLRRAIESAWPAVQTIGVAGFFGLPIAYTPMATAARRPQLPGLLAPALEATDCVVPAGAAPGGPADALHGRALRHRLARFQEAHRWDAASRWPSAAFSSVEAIGLGYLGKLARQLRPTSAVRTSMDAAGLAPRYRSWCRPMLAGQDLPARTQLAAHVLRGMGLTAGHAPLVLLVGHGSQSTNNAQAAALDCGACCGQSGEINARVLAGLLNDPDVRSALREHDIELSADVTFVAALHNTTTDEIETFDLDLLDEAARARVDRLQAVLAQAGDQVRRERAVKLGMDPGSPAHVLLARLRRRANDGAQTRPEWGLAGNAAFLIAPRTRSLGSVLEGRVFLHDYDSAADPDGSWLESLMTAPMIVTHWINWQYHASTCEPDRLGSGNKLLHNVVGGRIGVFEGNGGDLRIGLARQSLHDGTDWRHEPLRLTVVIDASAEAIERVIARHAVVSRLLHNGWLHLWRFAADQGFERYDRGQWQAVID